MNNEQYAFHEGDFVRLKAGGPLMVVRFPVEHLLLCAWTDSRGSARRATFSPDQLVLLHKADALIVRVVARLSSRCRLVAECC